MVDVERNKTIIDGLGGYQKVADMLGVNQSTVCNWYERGIPPRQAVRLQIMTKGEVSVSDLLPSISENL